MSSGGDRTSIQDLKIQIRRKDGKIFGPYSRREVLSFIYSKKLDGSESILFDGSDRWKSLNSDTDFFDALQEVLFGIKPDSNKKLRTKSSSKKETVIGGESTRADADETTRVSQKEPGGEAPELTKASAREKTSSGTLPAVIKKKPPVEKPATTKPKFEMPIDNSFVAAKPGPRAPEPNPFAVYAEPESIAPVLKPERKSKALPLVLVLAAIAGVYFLQNKKTEVPLPRGELSAQALAAAPAYFRPLLLRFSSISPLNIPAMPSTLNTSIDYNLPQGFGAQTFTEEVRRFVALTPDQRLDSAAWIRLVWSLKWLSEIMSTYSEALASEIGAQADRVYKELTEKTKIPPDFERLYSQIKNISTGKLAEAQKELATGTDEHSRWMKSEIAWLRYWQGEVTAESWLADYKDEKFTATTLESTHQVKKLFLEKSTDTVFWLDQLAVEDPESFSLWFVSAEYFWRIQSAYLQKSYLFWVSGLGAVSLYPRSYQAVYLEQMATLIKLFGRQDPARQISENAKLIPQGNIVSNLKKWNPIFGTSIDTDQLTDEILDSGASQRLAPIRLASLQNLAFTVSRRGGRKLLQVGYYWMFEKNYKRALETFESATSFEDAKVEAWGSKVWLYSERFQFDKALDALGKVNGFSQGTNQNDLYDAILHYFARDYDYARTKMEQFLKVSPGSGLGHYFYARILETQGKNVDCAKAAFLGGSNGVGEIGFRSRLLFYRCRVLAGLQVSTALADLEKMYQADPSNTAAVIEYIRSLSAAQLTDRAVQVGRDAVEKFPRSYELRLALGDAYLKARQYDKALAFYNNARRFRPEAAEAFIKIADLLFAQERFEEAAANYRVAAQLNPEYPEVWLRAAQSFRKIGKKDEALFAYNKELEARPAVLQTFLDIAEYLLELSSPQAVIDLFQKYQSSFDDDPRVSLRLSQAYLGLQNYEKARERAAFTLNKLPSYPEPYRVLGMIADFEGNYPSAKRYLQQYIKLLPQAADADLIRKKLSQPPYSD